MTDERLLSLPDSEWLEETRLPFDLADFTSREERALGPTELYELERSAANILHLASQRLEFLRSDVRCHFGILSEKHRHVFILSSRVEPSILETLFSYVITKAFSQIVFIIDGQPVTSTYSPANLHHIGLVRAAIEEKKENDLSLGIMAALALKPDKILLGLGGVDENPSEIAPEKLQLICDQLIGTVLNLTCTNLYYSATTSFEDNINFPGKKLAEQLTQVNGNPYNRLINKGSSVSSDAATERKIEAQRVLQFCRAVRAGTTSTKLADFDEEKQTFVEKLQLHEPDSRLNCSVAEWLRLNGLKARGLNIWAHLDIVSDRSGTFVPILNKQVGSRAFKNAPGLVEVKFPDGRVKLIHYDKTRINDMLSGLGRLIKSLLMIKGSLLQRGLGFGPRLKMLFLIELTPESFELVKRILSTSAFDMKKVSFVVMNYSVNQNEEDEIPLEVTADAEDRPAYEEQIQAIFHRLKKALSSQTTNLRAHAFRRACELAQQQKLAITMILSSLEERSDALYAIFRDADLIIKLDLIRIRHENRQLAEIDPGFYNQCNQTNGIDVEIVCSVDDHNEMKMAIRKSSDLSIIEREIMTAQDYTEQLIAIQNQFEKGHEKPPKTPESPPMKEKSKTCPDIWIPSRDTLLSIQRKNRKSDQRPTTVWYPPSSLAQAPKVNQVYPPPPKTSIKMLSKKSSSFYLDTKEKATTVYLTSSVKPPPVIPSCLKITNSETLDRSSSWLKKNGLKALKLNLERWERRITPGSKVYRGVLPTVRARHCELQVAELADVEALSYEAAKRYLKRIKWYLSESYRLWFQSCLPEVLTESAVVLIDVSDSSKSWIHEAITALRSLAHNSTGRLNFIQFNDGVKVWQNQCYAMNQLARDDLSLWLQCIRPYGGSNMIDALRKAYLYNPKHIVVITDGIFELKPFNVYTEITSANEKKQVPLHFILPSQKYKEPGFELMGYKSQQAELGAVVKMLKKAAKIYNGSFCIPPSPTSIELAINRIGHSQYVHDDQNFSPAVFKDCTEISLLMKEMRRAQVNAQHCRQWIEAAQK